MSLALANPVNATTSRDTEREDMHDDTTSKHSARWEHGQENRPGRER
jgi:hypothetical protein